MANRAASVFMSGYTEEAIARRGVEPAGTTVVEKPFSGRELVVAVRDALSEPISPWEPSA